MTARSRNSAARSIPAMTTLLARRPELAPCFPLADAFSAWAAWSA